MGGGRKDSFADWFVHGYLSDWSENTRLETYTIDGGSLFNRGVESYSKEISLRN